jgi:hypothetical protein
MKNFIPLKTYQGLSVVELKNLMAGRDVYIWGGGYLGQIISRVINKIGLSLKGFCDSNPELNNTYICGYKVYSPKNVLTTDRDGKTFIVLASGKYQGEMEADCISIGLRKDTDFLSYLSIPRQEAVIEISGECNYFCNNCPQYKNGETQGIRYMSASIYQNVLEKLMEELPLLININLSVWRNPCQNPEINDIIRITEAVIPCTVMIDLNNTIKDIENVLQSNPTNISILNIKNSSQDSFEKLLSYKNILQKSTPKGDISFSYMRYKSNKSEDWTGVRKICKEIGINFVEGLGYLNPYDKVLDYCLEKSIDNYTRKEIENLNWDIQEVLKLLSNELGKACLCQRIFPIINHDLSVSLCHVYCNPKIVNNFLEHPLEDIINTRHKNQQQCEECQRFGLHRLDFDLLERKYGVKKWQYIK